MAVRKPSRSGPRVGTVQPLRKAPHGSGARVLSRVPLFAGLSQRDLRRIATVAEEVWFNPGRVVVEEGSPGDSFYVILDGTARVLRGRGQRAIRRLEAGDHFGEMALLDGGPRSMTVVAESTLDAVRVQRTAFRRLLLKEPEVGLRIMAGLAARVREHERHLLG